jgi:hypothetical protein
LREVEGITNTVRAILSTVPWLLLGNMMVYETDNKAGWYDVMGMKGGIRVFPAVKELRLLCAAHDIHLEVEWYPRERDNQRLADYWSKHEDTTEWSLHPEVVESILSHPVLDGRGVTLDVFASTHSSLVPGAFFSRFHCVGSLGVNAFHHEWQRGQHTLAWIHGPFADMAAIIKKVAMEQVDCILIRPDWPRAWAATLRQLPIRHSMRLPVRSDLCVTPSGPRGLGYRVVAEFVLWGR